MKVSDAFRLRKWVEENRHWITVEAPTKARVCELASAAINTKVSAAALRDVLTECGIQTRRESQAIREKKALQEEVGKLRQLIIKLATACTVPQWLRDEIIADPSLTEDLKKAINRTAA